ncbi:sodium/calcium exchanger 1a isoform X1 [Silurus meridionalis]|uniref:sodium/calcium exchanger 1a isoform X1 n=1 Tax=Silurus meridionalis TaxID=175797 RepID=UPI001EEC44DA|nr:sodium/calcium exchanger 1a isoform X1 [Silurus meridionalis]
MGPSDALFFHPLSEKLALFFIFFSPEFLQVAAGGSTLHEALVPVNHTESCAGSYECKEGVILPIWRPENPSFGDKLARATIYFVAMAYMFLGVSIIADRFMASIEVITSQEKEITIKKPNGETTTTTVRIWNETVSNLTLMALGSSAPEILLSVVEVCGHNFEAGELGPNTIVGSAAFNMFVIIGLCVSVIPDSEHRKVKHLRVFFVTAAWSIFAYTWLYMILAVFSPGVVEVWEGLLTLFFFPICVVFAWVADRRLLFYKYVYKRYRVGKQRGMIIETEGGPEHQSKTDVEMDGQMLGFLEGAVEMPVEMDEEETRRELAGILKDLKQKYPEKDMEQLVEIANYQLLNQQQKSRAFYRCQATRLMTGAGNILKKHAADQARRALGTYELRSEVSENDLSSKIFFDPCSYQCLENCGSVAMNVVRRGGDLTSTVSVSYRTEDGTANAGSDYRFTEGFIVFNPGETEKEIRVEIIDDDIFEEDEHFLVHLSNVKVLSEGTNHQDSMSNHVDSLAGLGLPSTATVTIFDDDHAGIFTFEEPVMHVSESIGVMEVKVVRMSGARGVVVVPYKTIAGTAKGGGEDFEDTYGVLEFQNDEISKSVQINIIDDEEYEKNKNFFLEIGEPQLVEMSDRKAVLLHECGGFIKTDKQLFGRDVYRKVQGRDNPVPSDIITITDGGKHSRSEKEEEEMRIAELGRPTLGENSRLEVIIEESYEFKSTVDKLIKKTNLALLVGTNSWREQFVEAITVNSGGDDDDDDEECGEEKLPSCFDYIMHFLTIFWKVAFAFVPPTDYWNGWACFIVSICMIGLLTAFIGDLASHFGCTIGLKDSVTAVVFVALGTSVPDTFASKVAAKQDQYADASIGNVTGSNAVNVFLGIGIAWSIAAVFHQWHDREFRVAPGTLAFSVTLFTIFAFICIAVLMYRRRPSIGGELGGPRGAKILTSGLFFSLWLLYIVLSSLEAYCLIKGF